jgi:hypothetical protein
VCCRQHKGEGSSTKRNNTAAAQQLAKPHHSTSFSTRSHSHSHLHTTKHNICSYQFIYLKTTKNSSRTNHQNGHLEEPRKQVKAKQHQEVKGSNISSGRSNPATARDEEGAAAA